MHIAGSHCKVRQSLHKEAQFSHLNRFYDRLFLLTWMKGLRPGPLDPTLKSWEALKAGTKFSHAPRSPCNRRLQKAALGQSCQWFIGGSPENIFFCCCHLVKDDPN